MAADNELDVFSLRKISEIEEAYGQIHLKEVSYITSMYCGLCYILVRNLDFVQHTTFAYV